MGTDTNEAIDKRFETTLQRFQQVIETSNDRESRFTHESVVLLYYYFQKIDIRRAESHIKSPDWLENIKSPDWLVNIKSPNWLVNIKSPDWLVNIKSPDWLVNKRATINPKNEKDNKCFRYAITSVLNYKIKKKYLQDIEKLKRVDTDFSSYQREWEELEQNNTSIALNVLFV